MGRDQEHRRKSTRVTECGRTRIVASQRNVAAIPAETEPFGPHARTKASAVFRPCLHSITKDMAAARVGHWRGTIPPGFVFLAAARVKKIASRDSCLSQIAQTMKSLQVFFF